MDFLQQSGIIDCDGLYSKDGGKALGYKFHDIFISRIKEVEINKPTLFKKITDNVNTANNVVDDALKSSKEYFLNSFSIDFTRAEKFIENLYQKEIREANTQNQIFDCINRYNAYYMSIAAIRDNHLFYRKNKTNGRVDTNLTSLKKELKQFITTPDLYQLDIVNSQPLFLGFLVKDFKSNNSTSNTLSLYSYLCGPKFTSEMNKYMTWCRTGQFYENFKNEYNLTTGRTINRDKVKTMTYTILFSPTDAAYAKQANDIFKSIFPGIFRFINDYKKGQHNKLAIDLQKLESSMCIDTIIPLLNAKGIKHHYTIHDAWLMDDYDRYQGEQIIREAFYKKYGVEPKIYPTQLT